MKLLILLLISFNLFGQSRNNLFEVTPTPTFSAVGEMRYWDKTRTFYTGFKSSDVNTANIIWKLPDSDGTIGQTMVTDGAGILSWANPTGTLSACGPDTGNMFNDAGNCAANLRWTYNKTTDALQLHTDGIASSRGFTIGQHSSGINGAIIIGQKSRGTQASPTSLVSGDILMQFFPTGYDGATYQAPATIRFITDGAVSAGVVPTAIELSTGNAALGVKRLTLNSTGDAIFGAMVLPSTGGLNLGGVSTPWADQFFVQTYTETLRISQPGSAYGTTWKFDAPSGGGNFFRFLGPTATPLMTVNGTVSPVIFGFEGHIQPISRDTYDVGGNFPFEFRNFYSSANGGYNIVANNGHLWKWTSHLTSAPNTAIDLNYNGTRIISVDDQTFLTTFTGALKTSSITGGTQCVQANSVGLLSGTGSGCGSPPFIDTGALVYDSLAPTHRVFLKANLITADRNFSIPDYDGTAAVLNHTQTFTSNQTFSANIFAGTSGLNIGSLSSPFQDVFYKQTYTETLRMGDPGTTFGTTWSLSLSGTALTLNTSAPDPIMIWNGSPVIFGAVVITKATFRPSTDNNYDLGQSITTGGANTRWRNLFVSNVGSNSLRVDNGWFTDINISGSCTGCSSFFTRSGSAIYPTINTDFLTSNGAVLTIIGSSSGNGNILLRPGNVFPNSSIVLEGVRTDEPTLIIKDAAGSTSSNSWEARTNSGFVYAKLIAGTDPGAPGFLGANGFFCITSGTCPIGFSTNRINKGWFRDIDMSGNLNVTGGGTFAGLINANSGITTGAGTTSTIQIGTFGNFYTRPIAGSAISCSGINDGWLSIDTLGANILVCLGGNRYKVGLSAY